MTRISEAEMADVVENILRRKPTKSATFAELREIVPTRVKLSRADRAELPSRPGEQMWVQQVRNLIAHKREGFVGLPGGGICLEGYEPAKPRKATRKPTTREAHRATA